MNHDASPTPDSASRPDSAIPPERRHEMLAELRQELSRHTRRRELRGWSVVTVLVVGVLGALVWSLDPFSGSFPAGDLDPFRSPVVLQPAPSTVSKSPGIHLESPVVGFEIIRDEDTGSREDLLARFTVTGDRVHRYFQVSDPEPGEAVLSRVATRSSTLALSDFIIDGFEARRLLKNAGRSGGMIEVAGITVMEAQLVGN